MLSNSIALIALAAMFGIEAYKATERLPRIILTAIAVFFGLVAALIQPLADAAPKAVALVTAVFSQASSWFILLISLFFVLRPVWTKIPPRFSDPTNGDLPLRDLVGGVGEIEHLSGRIAHLDGKVDALSLLSQETTCLLKEKSDSLLDRIESAEREHGVLKERFQLLDVAVGKLESANSAQSHLLGEVRSDLDDVRRGIVRKIDEQHDFQEKMEVWVNKLRDDTEFHFANVDLAFAALSNREWHQRLFLELGDDFKQLAQQIDEGKGIGDWDAWQKSANSWVGKLEQWLIIADYYAPGTADRVRLKPDHLYYGDWQFDEGPLTANQVHRFKEVAIWWHNVQEVKKRVDQCFKQTIFVAPSKKGRLDSPPAIEDANDG